VRKRCAGSTPAARTNDERGRFVGERTCRRCASQDVADNQ
jgi:hypothetical protein